MRLTAQLALSDAEALLAYSLASDIRGPNGETHTAVLIHTTDAGLTWSRMPLRRTILDQFRHWGFPSWPPEAIIELAAEPSGLRFVFRDECIPFEPGGESLWQAVQRQNGKWVTSRIRYMDYDGVDSPLPVPEAALQLPTTIRKPDNDVLKGLV